ncbi:MAG TPA: hypothetical protein HA368_05305 [Nanoarchaeota archaeon]|nr:hypothetical protein [Nanoarchaeota archaeon]HIJ10131.1 hypothetical protein [Nanoarchaeota archaeon]
MAKRVKIGSKFVSIHYPKCKPWMREIYFGEREDKMEHGHISVSGAIVVGNTISAETWYARTPDGIELVKEGKPLIRNTSQLLSNCIPVPLAKAQHEEQSLFWNVNSLDAFS